MTAPDHSFHRWVDPAERGAVKTHHKLTATAEDLKTLAAWLDVPGVASLTAALEVERTSQESASVTGTYVATLNLVCGVSLEPFEERIEGAVTGQFRKPGGRRPVAAEEIEVALEDDDEPEDWTANGIDLGELVAGELSLAVPAFPRKPDATLDAPAPAPEEAKPNPFAVLRKLNEPGPDGA